MCKNSDVDKKEKLLERINAAAPILERKGGVYRMRRGWQIRWEFRLAGKRVQKSIYVGSTDEMRLFAVTAINMLREKAAKRERERKTFRIQGRKEGIL